MASLSWKFKSFLSSLKKYKFKAIFRYLYDFNYHQDINYTHSLLKDLPYRFVSRSIPLQSICYGHSINYPEWVQKLTVKINNDGYKSLETIKVVYDRYMDKYRILDGNHRLAALRRRLPHYQCIHVLVAEIDAKKVNV